MVLIQYYYSKGKTKYGPFTFEDLKRQSLHKDSLVWHTGMSSWISANDLPGLVDSESEQLEVQERPSEPSGKLGSKGRESIQDASVPIKEEKEVKKKDSVIKFFKKYFTYDDEYISGSTFWYRCFITPLLAIFFILPGIYWFGVVSFKRAKSLGWQDSLAYLAAISLAIGSFLMLLLPSPYFYVLNIIFWILWFSNGKKTV